VATLGLDKRLKNSQVPIYG